MLAGKNPDLGIPAIPFRLSSPSLGMRCILQSSIKSLIVTNLPLTIKFFLSCFLSQSVLYLALGWIVCHFLPKEFAESGLHTFAFFHSLGLI